MDEGQKLRNGRERQKNSKKRGMKCVNKEVNRRKDGEWKTEE